MTKASTPRSSLRVELSSPHSEGGAIMNSISRQACLTSSTWGVPGGAVRCRDQTTDEAEIYGPSTEMTAPAPVSLASATCGYRCALGPGGGGWPGR